MIKIYVEKVSDRHCVIHENAFDANKEEHFAYVINSFDYIVYDSESICIYLNRHNEYSYLEFFSNFDQTTYDELIRSIACLTTPTN